MLFLLGLVTLRVALLALHYYKFKGNHKSKSFFTTECPKKKRDKVLPYFFPCVTSKILSLFFLGHPL